MSTRNKSTSTASEAHSGKTAPAAMEATSEAPGRDSSTPHARHDLEGTWAVGRETEVETEVEGQMAKEGGRGKIRMHCLELVGEERGGLFGVRVATSLKARSEMTQPQARMTRNLNR